MASSAFLVADYYCVGHILAATIPASRLNGILARMHRGLPLTDHALDFLRQQNLPDLYRLARGEITHEAYIAGLDSAQLGRHQLAKAAHQAKESGQQALEAHYRTRKTTHPSSKVLRNTDWEAERKLRRKRDREDSEAVLKAQRARQAEWKAQRECNCEIAAAVYQRRATSPDYIAPTARDLARYFHLDHLADAVCPPLSDILVALFQGRPLSNDQLIHLRQSAHEDLYRLAFGKLSFDAYIEAAKAAEADAATRRAKAEAAEAARIARESDPEYIEMMLTQALYRKYGVSLADKSSMPRVTNLLRQVDTGNRMPEKDFVWLSTEASRHFTEQLREAYHRLEAKFYAAQFRRTRSPWSAIKASAHFRKSNQSATALALLDGVEPGRLNHPKVRSALLTTRGGVMRDLGRRPEAIEMGENAHALMPEDYRPCTLLGAVHMELHEFDRGQKWYDKARKLGAPEDAIDSELRSIFRQRDSAGREEMKRFLLAHDPNRYRWLNEKKHQGTSRSKKR